MRFLVLARWLFIIVSNIHVDAFTTCNPSQKSLLSPIIREKLFILKSTTNDGDNNNNNNETPASLETLQNELQTSNARVVTAEEKLKKLQLLLADAQKKVVGWDELLQKNMDDFSAERSQYQTQITQIEKEISDKRAAGKITAAALKREAQQRSQKLQDDIDEMTSSLQEAREKLERSQRGKEEAMEQLMNLEDALEYEQMNYEKQKKAFMVKLQEGGNKARRETGVQNELESAVEEEKARLKQKEEELQRDKRLFEMQKKRLRRQIDEEKKYLDSKITQFAKRQERLKEQMQFYLDKAKRDANRDEEKLKSDMVKKQEEISKLSNDITAVQSSYDDAKRWLQIAQRNRNGARAIRRDKQLELQRTIKKSESSIKKVQDTVKQMKKDEDNYRFRITNLENDLQTEANRRSDLETELSTEKTKSDDAKRNLERQLATETERRRTKLAQMTSRYDDLKTEMTERVESLRSSTSQHLSSVTDGYETRLSGLDDDLASILISSERTIRQMDRQIVECNNMISEMGTNVTVLRGSLEDREGRLGEIEGSMREVGKLSLKLTGRKIKNLVRRLKRKKDDEEEEEDADR